MFQTPVKLPKIAQKYSGTVTDLDTEPEPKKKR